MSKSQIRNLTEMYKKEDLINMCEEHLDPNPCKKSWNKDKLAKALVEGGYKAGGPDRPAKPTKPSKPSKPPSKPSKPTVTPPSVSAFGCGMEHKVCMKTKGKGGWSVQDIRTLATQCGIDVAGKTRDQLCAEIAMAAAARSGSSGSDMPPTPLPTKPSRLPDIPPYKPPGPRMPARPPVKPPTKPGRDLTEEVLNNLRGKGQKKHVCITQKIVEFYEDLYDMDKPTDVDSEFFSCIKSLYKLLLPVLDKTTLVTKRDLPSDDELSGYNGGWYSGPMDREILWKEIIKPCLAQSPDMPPVQPPVMPPAKPPAKPPVQPPTGKSARVNPDVLVAINEFLDNNLPLTIST